MCDTMVTKNLAEGTFLFGKNSDRDPGEPQLIQYADGSEGIDSPTHPEHRESYEGTQFPRLVDAHKTLKNDLGALISRPSWIWGAEMGVNEAGVAIGNEAVFARKAPERDGLLGMDILRLALHNSHTAIEAVDVISHLLETFGQGGNGSYSGTLRYHNSFLIADPKEAWVLESSRRQWVARKVEQRASISNAYQIRDSYELADGATARSHLDFSGTHASRIHLWFTKGEVRQRRSLQLLTEQEASWETIRNILRHHEGTGGAPDHSMRSICMDSTGFVKSRTNASLIVEYREGIPLAWMTGSPFPGYSPFLPFAIDKESFGLAPHADSKFAYRFALDRLALAKQIQIAPQKAKEQIAALAFETEQTCRSMVADAKASTLARTCVACLAEEQTYRERALAVLVQYGAESKSLHEKPESYYRCG